MIEIINQNLRQLNRQSKVPLYHQLYEILKSAIVNGDWLPGATVPPESELQKIYRVSQITVRQALENLVNDGLVYRERGRGTFVAQPAIETSLSRIISFTEDMRQRGFQASSRIIFAGLTQASSAASGKLRVPNGTELVQIKRLRYADGQPLSIEESSLVHDLVPGILDGDYESTSLRETIYERFGLQIARAKQSIRALNSSSEQARFLDIHVKDPLLEIERVSFTQHDRPIELLRIYYRADRYLLYTELQG